MVLTVCVAAAAPGYRYVLNSALRKFENVKRRSKVEGREEYV
jgi:hypothetical protein